MVTVRPELGGRSVGMGRAWGRGCGRVGSWGLGVVASPVVVENAVMLAQILQGYSGSAMGTLMLEISYHHSDPQIFFV